MAEVGKLHSKSQTNCSGVGFDSLVFLENFLFTTAPNDESIRLSDANENVQLPWTSTKRPDITNAFPLRKAFPCAPFCPGVGAIKLGVTAPPLELAPDDAAAALSFKDTPSPLINNRSPYRKVSFPRPRSLSFSL